MALNNFSVPQIFHKDSAPPNLSHFLSHRGCKNRPHKDHVGLEQSTAEQTATFKVTNNRVLPHNYSYLSTNIMLQSIIELKSGDFHLFPVH